MENQYKKTFPDLMVGKKIIYVHGFMSAGSSHTVQILRDYMPEATVIAPDLPIHPEEAMELLNNLVDTEKPDLIIGTSMGGMYTEMLYGGRSNMRKSCFSDGNYHQRDQYDG